MKCILTTNISLSGSLHTDEVAKALLLHRNIPSPYLSESPAELLFGCLLNDHLSNPVKFRREGWISLIYARKPSTNVSQTQLNMYRTHLNLHKIEESVAIQNQHGYHPQRWNNTGTIGEALPHKQYRVLVDGHRRTTFRNRRFLRKISEDTSNINLDNSFPDLNKASDINDPPTHVSPPESPPPNTSRATRPTTTVSNK